MKIVRSAVVETASGKFEQDISYHIGEKIRREIFVGFTREHLSGMIRDRCKELERQ